jgi:hypothetical protein
MRRKLECGMMGCRRRINGAQTGQLEVSNSTAARSYINAGLHRPAQINSLELTLYLLLTKDLRQIGPKLERGEMAMFSTVSFVSGTRR